MNEVEKMRSSQLADMSAPEVQAKFEYAKKLLARMRKLSTYDGGLQRIVGRPDTGNTGDIRCVPAFPLRSWGWYPSG